MPWNKGDANYWTQLSLLEVRYATMVNQYETTM